MNLQFKGRLVLLCLVVFFALPVVIGLTLHFSGWKPAAGQHAGVLVQPARRLDFGPISPLKGPVRDGAVWQGVWHLVYVSSSGGDVSCRDSLQAMRQIHASLAKDIGRLERVWLIEGPLPADAGELQAMYPDLVIVKEAQVLSMQLRATGDARYYLVDPLGNLMMRYPADVDSASIRKDLLKLLRNSWAG